MNIGTINSETITIILFSLIFGITISYIFFGRKKKISSSSDIENNEEPSYSNQDEIDKFKARIDKIKAEKEQLECLLRDQKSSENGSSNSDTKFLDENKKLKEEIEELEEEIEDFRSKIKKIKRENDEFSDKIDLAEKKEKALIEEKNELVKITAEQEKQIIENTESLNFIGDILNASNSNSDIYEIISEKTSAIVNHVKNEINSCFDDGQKISDEECEHWRNLELKNWIRGKKVIAIVGEFSAGKTSIVNRILSQDDPNAVLLPVNSKETTAIPTYISKGIDFNCQFYSPSGELKNIRKESFETLTKSVLDKINISSLIKYFVVSYNNKYLDNISILDTPGFGSNSTEIIDRTANVVKEADALFWVIDANVGELNLSSLNVIKSHLKNIPLYVIINKSDEKSEKDLNKLQEKIEKTIAQNSIKVDGILRFSNKNSINGLTELINSVQERKHYPIITEIKDKLDYFIKIRESELKSAKEVQRQYNVEDETIRADLKSIENNVTYYAQNIDRLVQFETHFWSANCYEISQSDYGEFNKSLNEILDLSGKITSKSKTHSGITKKQITIEGEINSFNNQLKKLRSTKETFIKLVKDYNPNLLN